jgi:hypothetical protein
MPAIAFRVALAVVWLALLVILASVFHSSRSAAPSCDSLRHSMITLREKELWDALGCDAVFMPNMSDLRAAVAARGPSSVVSLARREQDGPPLEPILAIAVYMSSVHTGSHAPFSSRVGYHVDSAALPAVKLLSSLAWTLQPGFRYVVYLGYDYGDPVYDAWDAFGAGTSGHTPDVLCQLLRNATMHLVAQQISVACVGVGFRNTHASVSAAVNVLVLSAVSDGAQYVVAVPDDLVFMSPWPVDCVSTLLGFGPSNFGAVGMLCEDCPGTDKQTLQAPVVHASHVEIFGYYTPIELPWW